MADTIFSSGNDQWVCPNDRQLALRAKLHTGWSVHTYQTEKQRRDQHLSPAEVEAILQVIQRAERLDVLEQQRIGRLVERLETLRGNVMGNGLSQCLLCGEVLGFLGSSSVFCKDCRKVWKRSGAWFYKGLPKYILPLKTPGRADDPHLRHLPVEPAERETGSSESSRIYPWARGKGVSSDSDSDSDLSSSSLEDRLPPTGVRDPKSDKPWRESGGPANEPELATRKKLSFLPYDWSPAGRRLRPGGELLPEASRTRIRRRPGAAAHTCNPSTLGGQEGRITLAQELETSLGNMDRCHLHKIF
ncbi:rab effector Noc2 isoform X5 [Callithrix jacchus]